MLSYGGRRLLVGFVLFGLVAASCGGENAPQTAETTQTSTTEATATSSATTVEVAPTAPDTTAAGPEPTSPVVTTPVTTPVTTSPAPATTVDTSREDFEAAQDAIVAEIIANSVSVSLLEAGSLDATGAILDQTELESTADLAIDVRVLVDIDGAIWFVVQGELGLLGETSIEFDAVEANGFTVVAETSLLGLDQGPAWVQEASAGSVIQLSPPEFPDGPQPFRRSVSPRGDEAVRGLELVGFILSGDIGVQDGQFGAPAVGGGWLGRAVRISIWLYLNLASASRLSIAESAPDAPPPEDILGSEWLFGHLTIEADSLPPPSDVAMYRDALLLNVLDYSSSVSGAAQLLEANEAQGERLMWFYANE